MSSPMTPDLPLSPPSKQVAAALVGAVALAVAAPASADAPGPWTWGFQDSATSTCQVCVKPQRGIRAAGIIERRFAKRIRAEYHSVPLTDPYPPPRLSALQAMQDLYHDVMFFVITIAVLVLYLTYMVR